MPIYVPGKVTLSRIQQYPAVIGEPWGGGYFAGYISHTADGNPTHALIVAPRETGATGTGYTLTANLAHKTENTATSGTDSPYDGFANTAAMVAAGIAAHPAAQFCVGLTIGGNTDWYLPSRYELDIAYFNLKPTTASNNSNFGINPYAIPTRSSNYTASYPGASPVALFAGGAESFVDQSHHSSTQSAASSTLSWLQLMGTGQQVANNKTLSIRVRAFRRIALP